MVKSKDGAHEKRETTQEEIEMDQLIEVLKSLVAHADNGAFAAQAVETLDRLQKSADEEVSDGLLNELKEAFGENDTITKEQFEEWQSKVNELIVDEEVAEDEVTEDEVLEDEVEKSEEAEEVEDEVSDTDLDESVDEEVEDEVVEEAESVEKSLSAQIEKQAIELKEAKANFKKAQQEIETLRIEKQRKELVEKSEAELSYLGKSADEVGGLLMSLKSAGVPDEVFTSVFDLLKSSSEMVKHSGFFGEFGTAIEPDDTDPETKMMSEAKSLVEKGEFQTVPQAFASLYKADQSAQKE